MSSDRPLRIAWLMYRGNPYSGGQGVYTRYMAREMAALGHVVDVISGQPWPILDEGNRLIKLESLDLFRSDDPWHIPRPSELKGREHYGIDALEFGHMLTSGFPEPWTWSLRARKYLQKHAADYDLIHDNQCLGWGVKGMQDDGLAVCATVHHPITVDRDLEVKDLDNVWANKWNPRRIKRRFSLSRWYSFLDMQIKVVKELPSIITVSENSKRDIHSQLGVPLDRMHVVPVGVDHEIFRPLDYTSRVRHRIMSTTSADVPLKGLRYLVEAVAKVRAEAPLGKDLELMIIGKKREGSILPDLLKKLGLDDIVTFVSGVSDQRIVELYNEAGVVVVPSLYEGFSLPAIEAMACAAPLVTTTGGAIPEVVGTDDSAALTVPPGDSDALAAAILRMLRDPALADRIGAGGRARVLDRFTWPFAAEQTLIQHQALLDAREHARRNGLAFPGIPSAQAS